MDKPKILTADWLCNHRIEFGDIDINLIKEFIKVVEEHEKWALSEDLKKTVKLKYTEAYKIAEKSFQKAYNFLMDFLDEITKEPISPSKVKTDIEKDMLEMFKFSLILRSRGLSVDIETQKEKEYFKGGKEMIDEMIRKCEKNYLINFIHSKGKYMTVEEKKKWIIE